jgi:hypothetical protein
MKFLVVVLLVLVLDSGKSNSRTSTRRMERREMKIKLDAAEV